MLQERLNHIDVSIYVRASLMLFFSAEFENVFSGNFAKVISTFVPNTSISVKDYFLPRAIVP